jgi:hypothetical protein
MINMPQMVISAHRTVLLSQRVKMGIPDLADEGYEVDSDGFLLNPEKWDSRFAEGLAPSVGIPGGLTLQHWWVINYVRGSFEVNGERPTIFRHKGNLSNASA